MDFEDVDQTMLKLWNAKRKWHLKIYHIWCVPANIIVSMVTMSIVFTGGVPAHHCDIDNNSTLPLRADGQVEQCLVFINVTIDNKTDTCSKWSYDEKDFGLTIINEWDLVCDNNFLAELSQSFFVIGAAISTIVVAPLADKYGRKKIYLVCNVLMCLTGIGTAFSVNYVMFSVFRIASGTAAVSVLYTAIVAGVELFPTRLRTFAGQMMFVYWSVGMMILDLCSFYLKNWHHIQLLIALLPVISVPLIWLVPESIPWLLANNRIAEAEAIIKDAAVIDHVTVEEHPFSSHEILNVTEVTKNAESKELGRKHLFIDPLLRRITLIMFYIWFVNSMVYAGMLLSAATLAGDKYLNFFLMAVVEIPSTISCMILLERIGRRVLLATFHIIGGVSLLFLVFVPTKTASGVDLIPLQIFLTLVGKFSITASYDIIVQYTLELYPTNIRNTGLGTTSITAQVGGILAPFTSYIARLIPWLPGMVFGVASFVAGMLALALPETKGRPLPQTVDEMKEWTMPHFPWSRNNDKNNINKSTSGNIVENSCKL